MYTHVTLINKTINQIYNSIECFSSSRYFLLAVLEQSFPECVIRKLNSSQTIFLKYLGQGHVS